LPESVLLGESFVSGRSELGFNRTRQGISIKNSCKTPEKFMSSSSPFQKSIRLTKKFDRHRVRGMNARRTMCPSRRKLTQGEHKIKLARRETEIRNG